MTEKITVRNDFLQESYDKVVHKSGLTVYVFPKKLSTAYAALSVRFGSLDQTFRFEDEDELLAMPEGIAHFLEHKMFESEDHIDTFDKFAAVGASANAYTSNEVTSYLFSTPDDLAPPLRILLNYVFSPYFTEKNVEKEKGIIAQEIKMYDDSPSSRLYYSVLELLYTSHAVKQNICGSVESIAKITPETLMRCYRAFYHPSNMVLIVSGDVKTDDVLALVDEALVNVPPAPSVVRLSQTENPPIAAKSKEFHMDIARPKICIGLKDTAIPSAPRDRERRALIMNLISDLYFGESTEFFERLYAKGLISHDFSAYYETTGGCGHMMLSAATDDPATLYQEIFDEFSAIRGGKAPTREDFERLRRVHYAEYIKDFDNTEEIATALLDSILDEVELFGTATALTSIERSELLSVAAQFFAEEQIAYATVYPMNGRNNNNA